MMSDFSFWRLCREYSIYHASLIIAGHDPGDWEQTSLVNIAHLVDGFTAIRTALCNAAQSNSIKTVSTYYDTDSFDQQSIDIFKTLISVVELDRFVTEVGLTCDAFRCNSGVARMGIGSQFYSKKLDAANRAWEAVTRDSRLLKGRSPKQALQKWLTEHAAELELLNKDGKPSQTAIEEISKVANWKPEGGATPTPTSEAPAPQGGFILPAQTKGLGHRESFVDLDDEIPF